MARIGTNKEKKDSPQRHGEDREEVAEAEGRGRGGGRWSVEIGQ
jgi:hypothetical protein